jgi:hypothetical protein
MKVLKAIDKFIDKHEETIFDVEFLLIVCLLLKLLELFIRDWLHV